MSHNIGDRFFDDGIEYEVVDVRIDTKEDGTTIATESAIPVSS